MIADQDLAALPRDRTEAFLAFERLANADLEEAWEREKELGKSTMQPEFDYMTSVLAAAKEYAIEELRGWKMPPFGTEETASACIQFMADAKFVVTQLRIRRSRRLGEYSVAFDAAGKQKLRHLLGEVRKTVDSLELSIAKKERLYARISALELEIDRERTRYEVWADLMIEAADDIGEAAKRLEPVVRIAERIGAAFGVSKRAEEAAERKRLPQPEARKRIDPPKPGSKTDDPRQQRFAKSDEEIPF